VDQALLVGRKLGRGNFSLSLGIGRVDAGYTDASYKNYSTNGLAFDADCVVL